MTDRNEHGAMTGFVAVIAAALVMVAGMAYDGGQVITAHNRARNDAERAARAGAQQLDLTHLRLTGDARLDRRAAERAVDEYLAGVGVSGSTAVSDASVTVTVTVHQPLRILPGADRTIVVSETATAVDGVQP